MDNASKNAKEMIGTLQMQYNRGRQAAITNKLVDITCGSGPLQRMAVTSLNLVFGSPVLGPPKNRDRTEL